MVDPLRLAFTEVNFDRVEAAGDFFGFRFLKVKRGDRLQLFEFAGNYGLRRRTEVRRRMTSDFHPRKRAHARHTKAGSARWPTLL